MECGEKEGRDLTRFRRELATRIQLHYGFATNRLKEQSKLYFFKCISARPSAVEMDFNNDFNRRGVPEPPFSLTSLENQLHAERRCGIVIL